MIYRFQMNYYDEINDDMSSDTGLIAAADWGDAANRVVKYYGNDNVSSFRLEELDDVLLDEDLLDVIGEEVAAHE